jgi:hypothetical protein
MGKTNSKFKSKLRKIGAHLFVLSINPSDRIDQTYQYYFYAHGGKKVPNIVLETIGAIFIILLIIIIIYIICSTINLLI